ncbi:MAG: hypothetical protein ACI9EF_003582, partial [Pseudohongiellaceae bacterium]
CPVNEGALAPCACRHGALTSSISDSIANPPTRLVTDFEYECSVL